LKYVLMGVAFALVAGTPASGQQSAAPAGATAEAQVQKKAEGKKKVCRRVEVTGSIMRESICRTVDQWAAEDEATRRDAEKMRDTRRSGSQIQ
jgi:hypothetical protein